MKICEYMKLQIYKNFREIIDQYNINDIFYPNGWVCIEFRIGILGLKRVGRIPNDRLTSHLANFGYYPTRLKLGLWKYESWPITFSLVMDNFSDKYGRKKHANHVLASLHQLYTVTEDWNGRIFIGMTLEWNYIGKNVNVSMPGYIPAMIHHLQHRIPVQHQDDPNTWTKPTYGAKVQYAPNTDNSPVLSDTEIRHIQSVIGNLLYYALAVDPTILVAIRTVFRERSKATKNCRSMQLVDGLLCVKPLSHNSIHSFRYGTLHSEQRFLSLWIPGKESRGGTFFLSDIPNDSNTPPIEIPPS